MNPKAVEKFRARTSEIVAEDHGRRIERMAVHLDELDDARELAALLAIPVAVLVEPRGAKP